MLIKAVNTKSAYQWPTECSWKDLLKSRHKLNLRLNSIEISNKPRKEKRFITVNLTITKMRMFLLMVTLRQSDEESTRFTKRYWILKCFKTMRGNRKLCTRQIKQDLLLTFSGLASSRYWLWSRVQVIQFGIWRSSLLRKLYSD
jgi:hypothetical protein